jgi:hypothetical protein
VTDEELEKETLKLFDRLGEALFYTIRDSVAPAHEPGRSRHLWVQVGKQLIKVGKESE